MMKKIFKIILIVSIFSSLVACGTSKQETTDESTTKTVENMEMVEEISGINEDSMAEDFSGVNQEDMTEDFLSVNESSIEEEPAGINEDGIGEDINFGEGIGEVVPLNEEERTYMQTQTTNSWLEMTEMEKSDLVVLIGRYLEETKNYIVEDYDALVGMLDHQMEQYYRYNVNESVFNTVIDILDIE